MARKWFTVSSIVFQWSSWERGLSAMARKKEKERKREESELVKRETERERTLFYWKNRSNGIKKKKSLLSYNKLSSFAKNFKYATINIAYILVYHCECS